MITNQIAKEQQNHLKIYEYDILLVCIGPDGILLPVVLLIHPDCFGVRYTVLKLSAVERE